MNIVLAEKSRSSTVSQTTAIEQLTRRVERLYGDSVKLPSRSTFFRLLNAEDRRDPRLYRATKVRTGRGMAHDSSRTGRTVRLRMAATIRRSNA